MNERHQSIINVLKYKIIEEVTYSLSYAVLLDKDMIKNQVIG